MENDEIVEVKSAPSFFAVTVKEEHESEDEEYTNEIGLDHDIPVNLKQEIEDEEEVKPASFARVDIIQLAEEALEEGEHSDEIIVGNSQEIVKRDAARDDIPSSSKVTCVAQNCELQGRRSPLVNSFKEERVSGDDTDDDPHLHLELEWKNSNEEDLVESILPFDDNQQLCFNKSAGIENTTEGNSRQPQAKKPRPCGRKTFACSHCNYATPKKCNLNVHMRIHTRERPFSCRECDATFSFRSRLETHLRTHMGERPYKCTVCSTSFSHLWNLKKHIRIHTGEKPHVCDICSSSFSDLDHLKRHKRVHTGDKPYVCDICSSSFSQLGTLKTHKRTHTGDKPYFCDECSSYFAHLGTLKRHKLTHTGDKSFRCDVCGRSFSRKDKLTSHMKCH